jgi:RHS repeat-associated protein
MNDVPPGTNLQRNWVGIRLRLPDSSVSGNIDQEAYPTNLKRIGGIAMDRTGSGVQENATALLAGDHAGSIRAVVFDGGHTLIAYTPYGYSPTHHGSNPQPAFNGEIFDQHIKGYILGNGYRAYSPSLGRFHRPDELSPFGEGGLNAYAYCAGDPVNRTDPDGHLAKFLRPAFRAIFGRTAPIPMHGDLVNARNLLLDPGLTKAFRYYPKPINNVKTILPGVVTFTDATKKGPRLNIVAHGSRYQGAALARIGKGRGVGPEDLKNLLTNSGEDFSQYSTLRTVMCYSAEGGANSFAAQLSRSTGLPVKGFDSTVTLVGGDPKSGNYPAMARIRMVKVKGPRSVWGDKYRPVTYYPE